MMRESQVEMIQRVEAQLFWEGHKKLRNLPHGFDIYLVNAKSMRKILQIFVAFPEKLNFTWDEPYQSLHSHHLSNLVCLKQTKLSCLKISSAIQNWFGVSFWLQLLVVFDQFFLSFLFTKKLGSVPKNVQV